MVYIKNSSGTIVFKRTIPINKLMLSTQIMSPNSEPQIQKESLITADIPQKSEESDNYHNGDSIYEFQCPNGCCTLKVSPYKHQCYPVPPK